MRIAIISTSDKAGGAAQATYRLHTGFRYRGLDSRLIVAERYSAGPGIVKALHMPFRRLTRKYFWYRHLPPKMVATWPARPRGFGSFSDHRYRFSRHLPGLTADMDVVNLHWVSRFLDYPTFFASLAGRKPLVWTMHDMNPFTGGCHIDFGCGKFRTICQSCPQLGGQRYQDTANRVWLAKLGIFAKIKTDQLHLVAPSTWLARQAQESSLLGHFPTSVIPNGLDPTLFKPADQQEARAALGIPHDARVVLFVANALHIRHKGFAYLLAALNLLEDVDDLLLLTVGKGSYEESGPFASRALGAVKNEQMMAQIYNAADLFIAPFLQDNLPNTIMESMACGTPAVGFRAGGIPDMIEPHETGMLVKSEDHIALAEAIRALITRPELLRKLGRASRQKALREYALDVQATRYEHLFETLMNKGRS